MLPIKTDINWVEKKIKKLTNNNGIIPNDDLTRYITGGKRLRSAIVLLIGKMLNAEMEPFYSLAASIELLHSATLAHDDLIDGGNMRRNQAISNSLSLPISLLAGDYLLARSTSELASLNDPTLLKIHSNTLLMTCEGEYQQWRLSGKALSKQTYYDIIQKKTASLFAGSAEMAAVLSGTDSKTRIKLRDYGLELGTLYQIVDDILDLIGDEEVLGKTLRLDLRRGTYTLPMIIYQEHQHGEQIRPSGELTDFQIATIIKALKKSGALEASLREVEHYAVSCKKSLSGLPEGIPHNALASLTDYLMDQVKSTQ